MTSKSPTVFAILFANCFVHLIGNNCFADMTFPLAEPGAQPEECGAKAVDLKTLEGEWQVPDPKHQFKNPVTCEYILTGEENSQYQMDFTKFYVGMKENNCPMDYVQVANNDRYDDPTVPYKKCGKQPPEEPVLSKSNIFYVKVKINSDSPQNFEFAATIKKVVELGAQPEECGAKSVYLTTWESEWRVPDPNHPFKGPVTCEYILTGEENSKYRMDFTTFNVGMKENNCPMDYVQVANNDRYDDPTVPYKKCGDQPPEEPALSKSNVFYLNVEITSDSP